MDLPDPAELWDYRLRLQRHGFRSDEAQSVVTGTARSAPVAKLETRMDWVDSAASVVSQCGPECSEMHTFDADCAQAIPEEVEVDRRLENTQVMQSETIVGMDSDTPAFQCGFVTEGRVGGTSVAVRCEPSRRSSTDTYLFVHGGHAFLSRDETILLRDTLTAILGDDS